MEQVKTERWLRLGLAGLVVALIAVVGDTLRDRRVGVGDTAPEFTITTDSGRSISASDFGGKLLVLNFWATWCPPCVEEMPALEEFHRRMRQSGVVVLGISVDKDENTYRSFLKRAGVSFLTARDPQTSISSEYGTYRYPETYVINSDRKVVQKIIGPHPWTDEKTIRDILSKL